MEIWLETQFTTPTNVLPLLHMEYIWFLLRDFKNISRYQINYYENIYFIMYTCTYYLLEISSCLKMKALHFVLICSHVKSNNVQSSKYPIVRNQMQILLPTMY